MLDWTEQFLVRKEQLELTDPDGFPACVLPDDEAAIVSIKEDGSCHAYAMRNDDRGDLNDLEGSSTEQNVEAGTRNADGLKGIGQPLEFQIGIFPIGKHACAVSRDVDSRDWNLLVVDRSRSKGKFLVEVLGNTEWIIPERQYS